MATSPLSDIAVRVTIGVLSATQLSQKSVILELCVSKATQVRKPRGTTSIAAVHSSSTATGHAGIFLSQRRRSI